MNRKPLFRRRYLVNWSLQMRYTILITCFSLFAAYTMGLFYVRSYWEAEASASAIDPNAQLKLLVLVTAVGLFFIAASTSLGLVVSNRWAGPLFRLERYLKQMAGGQLPFIAPPRKGDELHQLFASFRAASDALRQRQQEEMETVKRVTQLLEQNGASSVGEAVAQLTTLTAQMNASLEAAPPETPPTTPPDEPNRPPEGSLH